MNSNYTILIWVLVIGAVFGVLWWQGQLKRISNFVNETWAELQKCNWPTWDELKGATILVTVTIFLLGVFTVAVDWIASQVILKLT